MSLSRLATLRRGAATALAGVAVVCWLELVFMVVFPGTLLLDEGEAPVVSQAVFTETVEVF